MCSGHSSHSQDTCNHYLHHRSCQYNSRGSWGDLHSTCGMVGTLELELLYTRFLKCCNKKVFAWTLLHKRSISATQICTFTSSAGRFNSKPGTITQTCPHLWSNQSSLMTTVLGNNWLDSSHIHCSILWSRGHQTTASHVVETATWGNDVLEHTSALV